MRRTIETPGGPLSYELTRKAVKNLNFRLLPGGELAVSAPRGVLPEQVDALVRQKADWVEQARRRQETRRTAADSQGVWLLGKRLRLTVVPGERDGFAAGVGVLILTLRPGDDQEERRLALVKAFLEQEGREVLPASLCRMHRLVEPLGVPFPKMTTRWAVARWGSCAHREGRISINKALVCVPPSCVDYVMLHELVHFLHPDHSPAFHARMAALLPDCREREAVLRRFSPRLALE